MSVLKSRLTARTAAATLIAVVATALMTTPSAANVTGVTATTTSSVGAGETTTLGGMAVAADSAGEDVSVIVSTDVGSLGVSVGGTGATIDTGYAASGTEIAFSGTVTQVNAALATVTLTTVEGDKDRSATIDILARNSDGTVYSPVTEHFYEYIEAPGITWTGALAQAPTHTYAGQQGYLASVPNASINELITSKIPGGAPDVWLGGRAFDSHDGYVRVWEWAAGPLAGDHFTRCANNAFSVTCTRVDMDGLYQSWASGEPNNYGTGEFYVVTNWTSGPGQWNDLANNPAGISGYVVEYGDLPIGASVPYTGLERASAEVFIVGVPDPVQNLGAQPGVGSATVSWDAPASDGGLDLTSYEVSIAPGGVSIYCASATATSCEITGLTPGTSYTVTVTAINAAGESETRTTTVTPGSVPGAVAGPLDPGMVGEPYTDQVTAAGHPAPEYAIVAGDLPEGLTLDTSTGAITGTPTTPGPWSVEIAATNGYGTGPATEFSGTVGQVPTITTTTVGPFTWGVPVDVDLAAVGFPAPEWTASSLPPGLTLEEDGRLHGTPTAVGDHSLAVTATNEHDSDTETFAVSVRAATASAPAIDGITPGDGNLTLTVTPPASNGGSPITGYEYTLDGGDTWLTATEDEGEIVIDGLTNGTEYDVQVRVINAAGESAASASASGTPRTVPDAPILVSATPGDGEIVIDFDAGAFDGGSEVITFEYTLDGGDTWTATTAQSGEPFTVSGANGTEYDVAVRAVNEAGASAPSASATVTPFTTADAPEVTSVVEGDGELTVQFTAPAFDGGATITGYEYSIDGGDTWAVSSAAPGESLVIDGLTNGTEYDVIVRAVNASGPGAASAPASGTPRTTADAPVVTAVTPGDGTVTVAFDEPAFDGGSPVTGYEYTTDGGATWHPATVTDGEIVIDGLTNGTEYDVAIRAVNEAGESASSDVTAVTPYTTPDATAVASAEPGSRSATIVFDAPAFDGGSPVTGYEYSTDGGTTWHATDAVPGEELTIHGLTNGTEYEIVTRAVNAAGPGASSEPALVTPVREPVMSPGGGAGLPDVEEGDGAVIVDGESAPSTTRGNGDGITVSGGGVTTQFSFYDANGDLITVDAASGDVTVHEDGSVLVSGQGFAPGSTVDVWLLSSPVFLGEVTVGADGTFSAMLALPEGVELGHHTIQLNGLSVAGQSVSVNTGLTVVAAPVAPEDDALSSTGADLRLAGIAALVLLAGMGLAFAGRRRQASAGAERA